MDRRKELKAEYKRMKPDMGVFIIRSNFSNKCYLEATQNLKGTMNSVRFRLEHASAFSNISLHQDWKDHGEAAFTMEVLETLEYDADESRTDYSEDLALLKMIWEEKLSEQGMVFYE